MIAYAKALHVSLDENGLNIPTLSEFATAVKDAASRPRGLVGFQGFSPHTEGHSGSNKSVMSPKKRPPPLFPSHVIFYAPFYERQKKALSWARRGSCSLPPRLPSFSEKNHWQGLGSINSKRHKSAPQRVGV